MTTRKHIQTISIFAFSLILAALGPAVAAQASLTAYYKMDGNLVDSAGGNNANAVGTVNFVAGVAGQAMDVDAASHAISQSNVGISGLAPRTLSLWFNQDTGNGDQSTVSWGGRTASGTLFENLLHSGASAGHWWGFLFDNLPDAPAYSENTWTHFAMTYDGTTAKIYQDGAHIPAADRAFALPTTDTPLYLGGGNLTNGGQFGGCCDFELFDGSLDEVRIYDTVLDDGQIFELFNNPGGPSSIPEPSTFGLLVLGLMSLGLIRRRRSRT